MEGNHKLNIAVLIDVYNEKGGASNVAVDYGRRLREYGYESYIVANNIVKNQTLPDDILIINSICEAKTFLVDNDISVVHYFKSQKRLFSSSIIYKFTKAADKIQRKLKTLITVCQRPSNLGTILTPFEVERSNFLVFIDKAAFLDPLYDFIPEDKKTWMYLSSTKEMIKKSECEQYVKKDYEPSSLGFITFGRGSTLNKCPKDLLDLYDKIQINQNKKFIIVGMPESNNWLEQSIKRRGGDDISTYPTLKLIDYAKIVSSFDVMLYYLPQNAHSSIDGSLTMALRLGVPVVVYGPEAPKESIVHGENGYIANTKEEFVNFAKALADDKTLREKIGKKARELFIQNAPDIHWSEKHIEIINKLYLDNRDYYVDINLTRSIYIYILKYLGSIEYLFSKTIQKLRGQFCLN